MPCRAMHMLPLICQLSVHAPCVQVAPPQLSEAEQRAAVERFLDERCHFLTVAAANCVSLMIADPQHVYER